jgi:hypothetical protein
MHNKALLIEMHACGAPACIPSQTKTGGEDAFFLSPAGKGALGVADGVGSWCVCMCVCALWHVRVGVCVWALCHVRVWMRVGRHAGTHFAFAARPGGLGEPAGAAVGCGCGDMCATRVAWRVWRVPNP